MREENKILKKSTKILVGDDEFVLSDDMSIDEVLENLRDDPAYSNVSEDNCVIDEDGNFVVNQPKSKTHGL